MMLTPGLHQALSALPKHSMNLRLLFAAFAVVVLSSGEVGAEDVKGGRVLFVGNSITLHGPSEKIGWTGNWGMAASAQENDYVHLVVDALSKRRGRRPEFSVVNLAEYERAFESFDVRARLKGELAFHADVVILAIGENVPSLKTDEAKAKFEASVVRLLTLLKGDAQCALYVRSCFWADAAKDAALKDACAAVGGIFVDISALGNDEKNYARSERKIAHEGVARHPGDQGMRAIADAVIAAIAKSSK